VLTLTVSPAGCDLRFRDLSSLIKSYDCGVTVGVTTSRLCHARDNLQVGCHALCGSWNGGAVPKPP